MSKAGCNKPSRLCTWAAQQMFGDSPPGLQALTDHISALPGLEQWIPAAGGMHLLEVLCLAATLGRIDHVGCALLTKKISKSILRDGRPDTDDMAELTAAALVREWADEVCCTPRQSGKKTPDFQALMSGEAVELEVTNSDQKEQQTSCQLTALRLGERLQAIPSSSGFRVRFVDQLSDVEVEALVAAARELKHGEIQETRDRWYIEAVAADAPPLASVPEPEWWHSPFATLGMLQTSVTETFGNSPSIGNVRHLDIQGTLSTASYLNSLSKKQDAEQASGSMPFLVVCVVTQLLGAFGWYAANLPPYLEQWSTKLSAVMLVRRGIEHGDTLRWEFMLFVNPNATLPLPSKLQIPTSGHVAVPFYAD